ncbi:major facilitator superfamily transporter maltose permease [Grosmannia clavigera kw1407]|uniref:Major facilitator superfamily transporter maltose permease n=1 Tax=Grosmannia clavigera (strain kw1407 / UAMH 11150) TaxID=655863 RepID=F0XJH0_GROCL|nr:major facilitator superfamily transporter maltose permease [Grosmannia clavigera kw1407]EFX02038.1 major facilitator superfamily transporter maltose permease [Grosmannia clavigera kw1407]
MASTYIAEICPPTIAGFLTAFVSCCWVIGQLSSSGILWAMIGREGVAAFRIPMAAQWIIPVPIIVGCYFAPPSPWWLARRGRLSEALDALKRLANRSAQDSSLTTLDRDPPLTTPIIRLVEIQEVIALEENDLHIGATYKDCFRKTNLRRMEISVMTNLGQNIAGFAIASQLVDFMRLAGLDSSDSFKMAFWATLSLSPNTVACAVSASDLRTKTLVLSRMASDATNLVQAAAGPYMLSVEYGNLQGYAAFPATAAVVVWITWAIFRLPRTDGIPQRIIDHLFQTGVPARQFPREAEKIQEWEASANRVDDSNARGFDLQMVEHSIVQLGHDRV